MASGEIDRPADYGMSFGACVVCCDTPPTPPNDAAWWHAWRERVFKHEPTLRKARPDDRDPSDPTPTHTLIGDGGDRIGVSLVEPPAGTAVRGGLVVVLEMTRKPLERVAARYRGVAERGTVVMLLVQRGFAGSCRDGGAPAESEGEWMCRGLEPGGKAEASEVGRRWIVSRSGADVCHAVRALRGWIAGRHGARVPIGLDGRCVGSVPAMVAVAVLTGTDAVDRLALSHPGPGLWPWRLKTPHGGAGEAVREHVAAHSKADAELSVELMRLDAVHLAPRVLCPTLMKLAIRDEVVPPHTQFAVFNRLGAPRARRWRFLCPFGHHAAGAAMAERHALYEKLSEAYFDFRHPAHAAIEPWVGVLSSGDRREAPAQGGLFGLGGDADTPGAAAFLIGQYEAIGRTLDALPYTPEFDRLFAAAEGEGLGLTRRQILDLLQRRRKAGALPKLGRATDTPPRVSAEDEAWLVARVAELAGSVGRRDGLPYTEKFDRLVTEFNEQTGLGLDPHSVWRLVAKLAK